MSTMFLAMGLMSFTAACKGKAAPGGQSKEPAGKGSSVVAASTDGPAGPVGVGGAGGDAPTGQAVVSSHQLSDFSLSIDLNSARPVTVKRGADGAYVLTESCASTEVDPESGLCRSIEIGRAPATLSRAIAEAEAAKREPPAEVETVDGGWVVIAPDAMNLDANQLEFYRNLGGVLYHCRGSMPEPDLRAACLSLRPR